MFAKSRPEKYSLQQPDRRGSRYEPHTDRVSFGCWCRSLDLAKRLHDTAADDDRIDPYSYAYANAERHAYSHGYSKRSKPCDAG